MIDVTLRFNTAAEAADALARMAGLISPADRPDAGQAQPPKPLLAGAIDEAVRNPLPAEPVTPNAAAIFGGAAAQVVPPPPAPSTAVVAPPPTAPAVAGLAPPPPVTSPAAPPPVPPAGAPTAPAAPTSPAGVELDSGGIPWDGRIHGSTKAKNADGTWRQKRGLNDPALRKRIEAELLAALAAGTLAPAAAAPPPAAAPTAPAVPPAAPPAPPAPPAAPPTPAAETFATLIARITPHLNPARLTDAHVARVMSGVGLTGIAQLATRPDLVPAAALLFDAELAGLPA